MLQPRNGSSWVGVLSPGPSCVVMDHELIKVPPLCKKDSQSQCSVHKLPWCPSLPGILRQSNTVGYSMHGYLSGVEHEMKHQKKRSPFLKSFGKHWLQTLLRDQYISCFSVFLCTGRKPPVRPRVSFFLCQLLQILPQFWKLLTSNMSNRNNKGKVKSTLK